MSETSGSADVARAARILQRAVELTRSGSLTWTSRDSRAYAYEVDLPSGNIEVGTVDNDGTAPYNFKVYTPRPYTLVAELNGRRNPEFTDDLRALWQTVERQVSGIDDTLDGLLSDLENLGDSEP